MTNLKTERNEMDTKRASGTMNWFFRNINMTNEHLVKLIKKEKTQIRGEDGVITTGYN